MAVSAPSNVEEMIRAHARLVGDLRILEQAARPYSRESLSAFRTRLQTTRRDLVKHFRFEEQDGYMNAIRTKEPRLGHKIDKIGSQHQELLHSLELLIVDCKRADRWSRRLRDETQRWVRLVRQHERNESRLVQEVFGSDIGAED